MKAKNNFYGLLQSFINLFILFYLGSTKQRGLGQKKGKFNSFRDILTDLMVMQELDPIYTSLNN